MISSMNKALSRTPKGLVCALITLPFVLSLVYVGAFGVNVAWGDQLSVAPLFTSLAMDTLNVEQLFRFHNEHRILFPRLAMLSLGALTDYNNLAEMYLVQLSLLATMILLLLAFRKSFGSFGASLLFFVPVAFLVFSFRQYENMLWGFQITFVFVQTFGVLALYLLHASFGGKRPKLSLAGAMLCGFVAAFSALPGLMAWPAGLAMVLISGAGRAKKLRLGAAWCFGWVLTWALYFSGFSSVRQSPPFLEYLMENPVEAVMYIPTFLGSGLFWHRPLALIWGMAFILLMLVTVSVLYRRGKLGEDAFWIGLLLFSLTIATTVFYGRASLGPENATASRYSSFSVLAVVGVYVTLLKLALETRARAFVSLAAALSVVLVLNLAASYYAGVVIGRNNEALKMQIAAALYNYKTAPDERLRTLLRQPPEYVRQIAVVLDRLDYNVFSEQEEPETDDARSPPGRT